MSAAFNKAIDSLSLVGDRLSLAHVFTGIGPDLGLGQIMKCSRWKKASMKQSPADQTVESVSPFDKTIIGHRSAAEKKLRETEDDRWLQVEGGSPLQWRSCRGCAFLCAAQDATCEACGLAAPEQCSDGCISDSSSSSHADQVAGRTADALSDTSNDADDLQEDACTMPSREVAGEVLVPDVVIAECLAECRRTLANDHAPEPEITGREVPVQHLDDVGVVAMPSASAQDSNCNLEESANDAASQSSDDEADSVDGDEVEVTGTLDKAPLPGTLVKVFYDDDDWHLAKVLTAVGSKARVLFDKDGTQATLDLTTHAVRLADYESDDEGSDEGSDCLSDSTEGEEDHDNSDDEEECESEVKADLSIAPTQKDMQAINGEDEQELDEEEDLEEEEEEEFLEGLLEEAPAVDSLVKVLFENGLWHTARVKTSNGTKAVVVFEDDEEQELDFEEDAVRPFDFVEVEEQHEDSQEGESTPQAVETVQVVPYTNTEEEEVNDDMDAICAIDPVEEDEQRDESHEAVAAPGALDVAQVVTYESANKEELACDACMV